MHHFKMKTTIIRTAFLFITISCYSQNKFLLNSSAGIQTVVVNDRQYSIDSTGTQIATNYPKFDTLYFRTEHYESNRIICNFKPDSAYSISHACCANLDIIPRSKLDYDSLKYWDYEDFYKIQNQLMDKPFISIRTKTKTKDSIYAWHADAACVTKHKVINTKLWRLGIPPKCYYWNNITTIQFFKKDDELPNHEDTFLEEFLGIKNIVELTSISFRLFDNERFVVIYDEKNNKASLEYE